MLTSDQIDRYRADGYVIPDYRVPDPVLDDIRSAHDRLIERHPQFVDYCPALLAFDTGFLNEPGGHKGRPYAGAEARTVAGTL